jgi:hypothetical protein
MMTFKSDRSTLPTSTMSNRELDRVIVDREKIDPDAPWAYRVYATIASSLRKWVGHEK